MEQVEISLSEAAIADLGDIENYIAEDSPSIARRFIGKIFDRIEQLKYYPLSGKHLTEINNPLIREILLGKYRIVYKIDGSNKVYILRVIHSSDYWISIFSN